MLDGIAASVVLDLFLGRCADDRLNDIRGTFVADTVKRHSAPTITYYRTGTPVCGGHNLLNHYSHRFRSQLPQ